mgnify:FL=1
MALKHQDEEQDRIKEENRRIKEWEDKFDQEQRMREDELIKKFYRDEITKSNDNEVKKNPDSDIKSLNEDEENKNN